MPGEVCGVTSHILMGGSERALKELPPCDAKIKDQRCGGGYNLTRGNHCTGIVSCIVPARRSHLFWSENHCQSRARGAQCIKFGMIFSIMECGPSLALISINGVEWKRNCSIVFPPVLKHLSLVICPPCEVHAGRVVNMCHVPCLRTSFWWCYGSAVIA